MQNTLPSCLASQIICYFILLFAYTGGSKLIDIDPLYTSLRNTPLYFGKSLALIISWGLPAVEIATALSLCFSKFRYTGLICAGILIFVFIMYTGWIVIFPMQQPCSCGGILAEMRPFQLWIIETKQENIFSRSFLKWKIPTVLTYFISLLIQAK